MAAIGFIACFLLLVCFTAYIIVGIWGSLLLKGSLSKGELLLVFVLAFADFYLWLCLFDNSPFILVTK